MSSDDDNYPYGKGDFMGDDQGAVFDVDQDLDGPDDLAFTQRAVCLLLLFSFPFPFSFFPFFLFFFFSFPPFFHSCCYFLSFIFFLFLSTHRALSTNP